MVRWVFRLIFHGGPIELFLIPASAPCLWDGVCIKDPLLLIEKSSPCSGGSRFPLSLSEWYFTCTVFPTSCNHKLNVLRMSLNKIFPSFLFYDKQ